MISRYDVRVHMDYIPEYAKLPKQELSKEETVEENKCNYERFRSLVHHTFKGDDETDVLAKLEVEDIYHEINKKKKKDQKRVSKSSKAAIGFDYEEGVGMATSSGHLGDDYDEDESSDDEYKMDFDVDELSTKQVDKLNVLALEYGISRGFYSKSLRSEKSILMERKDAKIMELEKSALSGKKARKERRLFKDMMLRGRDTSPPLYIRRNSPTYEPYHKDNDQHSNSSNSSRSSSPDDKEGTMEFITEFGMEEKVPHKTGSSSGRKSKSSSSHYRRRRSPSHSPARYSSRDKYRSSTARSRSRSHSRERRYRNQSRSRSRSPIRITKHKLISKKVTPSTKHKIEKSKQTPQERLKKKMQAQLSRTFKEDKKAEKEKAIARETKEMEREEHLKEETRKLRERERHRLGRDNSRSPSPYHYKH